MEEKNEILTAVREGFARVDERLGRIEGDVSELKSDVSDFKSDVSELKKSTLKAHINIETLTDDVRTVAENVIDMRAYIDRYDTEVEAPLAERVTSLEVRVWVLEQKKSVI